MTRDSGVNQRISSRATVYSEYSVLTLKIDNGWLLKYCLVLTVNQVAGLF